MRFFTPSSYASSGMISFRMTMILRVIRGNDAANFRLERDVFKIRCIILQSHLMDNVIPNGTPVQLRNLLIDVYKLDFFLIQSSKMKPSEKSLKSIKSKVLKVRKVFKVESP